MTQKWRQMTVGILNLEDNPAYLSGKAESHGAGPIARVKEVYYRNLAQNIRGDGSFLLKGLNEDNSPTYCEELIDLIRATSEVSALFWVQKTKVTTSNSVMGKDLLFNIESPNIEAHSCMCLEKGSRQYDGRRVQLIIEPALFEMGDKGCKNHGQGIMRAPAIGWLSEEEPEQILSLPPPTESLDLHNTIKRAAISNDDVGGELERPSKRLKHAHVSEGLPVVDSVRQTYGEQQQGSTPSADRMKRVNKPAPSKEENEDGQWETTKPYFHNDGSARPNENMTSVPGKTNANPTPGEEDETLTAPHRTGASLKSPAISARQISAPQDTRGTEDTKSAIHDRNGEVGALDRLEVARADEAGKGAGNSDEVPNVKEGTLEVSYADFLALGRHE
jgi:hypothetical protein